MEDPAIQASGVTELPPLVNSASTVASAVLGAANNATTKFTPTTADMVAACSSLVIMALIPIFWGSFKSIKHQVETKARCEETGEQAETMTDRDAMIFPLIASCALFGFYILTKLFPEIVNIAVSGYFFLLGVCSLYRLIRPTTEKIFPSKYNSTQYTFLFGSKKLDSTGGSSESNENLESRSGTTSPEGSSSSSLGDLVPTNILLCSHFTYSDVLAFILAGAFGVWYIMTKHWVANNAFGLAFALNGIELLPVNSVRIGCILLCGLFFYDVFWVFGTDVMVSVARNFDAPIKIMFPQDFLIKGFLGRHFSMLGLGDIVIPGIYIAFLLRFDQSLKRKQNVYFWSCFLAYILGLGITMGVMLHFKHAQPALLYLVPCCIIVPFIVAIGKGDFKALLNYRDHPIPIDEEEDEEVEGGGGDEESDSSDLKGKKSTRSISTRSSKKDK